MDREKITLIIQVFKDNNNIFKITSNENITYTQLKQETIEKFKIPEDEIKYMSFSYKDNEGLINYINEYDNLGKLADEISPGNFLLKLNFEINLYESKKVNINNYNISYKNTNIPNAEENYQNEQKKLDKEINDSKINQLNLIIQEKDKEILKLKNEIEKLKNQKSFSQNNDPVLSHENKNDTFELKNQISSMKNELKNDIENIKNKFENTINELKISFKVNENNQIKNITGFENQNQNLGNNIIIDDIKLYFDKLINRIDENQKLFVNEVNSFQESSKSNTQIFRDLIDKSVEKLINKIDNNQKLLENKIEDIKEFSKSNIQNFGNLIDEKSKEIINKTNENTNNQFKQIEEGMSNNMLKIEKPKENIELNNKNENINNINDNGNIMDENKIINTDKYKDLVHKNSRCQKCQKKPIIGIKYECLECNYDLCFECHNHVINNGEHNHNFKEIIRFKTIEEEVNDFLNSFFFEKEITVSKKDIQKENVIKFFEINTKLKKDKKQNIIDYLIDYFNKQSNSFKNKKDFSCDETNIKKQFEKRSKILKEQFFKANVQIKKFRNEFKLNENDYNDDYIYQVLIDNQFDFKKAFEVIINKLDK